MYRLSDKTLSIMLAAKYLFVSIAIVLCINGLFLGGFYYIFGEAKNTVLTILVLSVFLKISTDYKYTIYIATLVYVALFVSSYSTNIGIVNSEQLDERSRVFAVTEANNIAINAAVFLTLLAVLPSCINKPLASNIVRIFVITLWLLISILPISAIVYWFLFDAKLSSDSIIAVYQTNYKEAVEFFSHNIAGFSIAFVSICVIVITLVIYLSKLKFEINLSTFSKILFFFCLLFSLAVLSGLRFHNGLIIVTSSARVVREYAAFQSTSADRLERLASLQLNVTGRNGLFVFIIGESLTRDRMSLYKYHRNTTPWQRSMLNNDNFFVFNQGYANATLTVHSLAKVLTSWDQYHSGSLSDSITVTDIARATDTNSEGYYSIWISNQFRSSASTTPQSIVAATADSQIWLNDAIKSSDYSTKYDGEIVNYLRELPVRQKQIVFIHLLGNHYEYHHRYPNEFNAWNDGSNDDNYDNSVLYNDHVLKEIYQVLSKRDDFQLMLYLPDHGEDTALLHNPDSFKYNMARIPMWILTSDDYRNNNQDIVRALSKNADKPFTNDMFFDTYCGLIGATEHKFYKSKNDLSSNLFNYKITDLVIYDGRFKVVEDPALHLDDSNR